MFPRGLLSISISLKTHTVVPQSIEFLSGGVLHNVLVMIDQPGIGGNRAAFGEERSVTYGRVLENTASPKYCSL